MFCACTKLTTNEVFFLFNLGYLIDFSSKIFELCSSLLLLAVTKNLNEGYSLCVDKSGDDLNCIVNFLSADDRYKTLDGCKKLQEGYSKTLILPFFKLIANNLKHDPGAVGEILCLNAL
jgi:hypothetical protein